MRRTLLVGTTISVLLTGCGGNEEPATGTDGAPAPAGNVLEASMTEYAFEVEGDAQAGPLRIEFTNVGEQLHHAIIGKLAEGKTLEDVQKFLQKGQQGPPPPWFDDAPIDMTIVSPDKTAGVVLDAEEGTYVVLCFMPDTKGKPHVAHGMVQTFDVGPSTDTTAIEADTSISMTENGPEAPELSAGTSIVEVTNDADRPGEVFVVQLAEGKTLDDVEPWFGQGQKGTPPATFYGGTHVFGPGESVTLSFTLDPGEYSILASFGEGRDVTDIPTEFTVSE